jgi:hypothetical protein
MPALALAELRPTLLINDYQNARVDAAQFQDLAEEVKALSGDCVCCGSRDELFSFLREFQHAPGRVMIVETNGTTDSAHLIEFLALDPGLKKFSLPIQLSIIDGKRWQKRFWHNALEREQAKTASHVYISRKDSIGTDRVKSVENSLAEYGVRGVHTDPVAFAMELSNVAASAADSASLSCTSTITTRGPTTTFPPARFHSLPSSIASDSGNGSTVCRRKSSAPRG